MSSPPQAPLPQQPSGPEPLPNGLPPHGAPAPVANLEVKARLLILFMLALVVGSALYVLYARGAFESSQRLVLMADNAEGVVVGMDMTFSVFPIARVSRVELAEDGRARILLDVATKDAHWLRSSSVFTLVRGLVGGPSLRAYSGILSDPLLPNNAIRTVLQGDASAEIPQVVSSARALIDNLNNMTSGNGAISATVSNLQRLTYRLNGPGGALAVLMGTEAEAQKFTATLERTNALLARLDGLARKADTQVFGAQGVMPETRATVVQLNAMLGEARTSLKKVDAILLDAQAISANAKDASTDLVALRAEVEASLRKVESLVTEINRKWPFARDAEMKLP